MKKISVLTITLLAMFALCTNPAFAEMGKYKVGSLTILPSIGLEWQSDDNVYQGNGSNNTTEKVVSDAISHIKPAVMFDYKFDGRGGLKFGYKGDLAYYETSDNNNWQSHSGLFDLNYNSPGGLIVGVNNNYTVTEDPFSNESDYLNAATRKVERWNDTLKAKVGYKLGDTLKVLGYCNYYIQDYQDDVRDFSQDYNQMEFGAGVEMALMAKTWGFLRYHYGVRDYTTETTTVTEANDSDQNWHRVNGGIAWDSGAKWSGELNLGYQSKAYENERDPLNNIYEEKNTWIAATNVKYAITEATRLGVTLNRALKETRSDTTEYNEETAYGINASHTMMEILNLSAAYVYTKNEYNTNNREDDTNMVKVDVDYKIQPWLTAGAGYVYKERDSNLNANDYKDNQFVARVKAGF